MTITELAAQVVTAPNYATLEADIADLDAAVGQRDKSTKLKKVMASIATCRTEIGLDPGLFAAAQ